MLFTKSAIFLLWNVRLLELDFDIYVKFFIFYLLCKIFYFLQQFLNFKYSNEKENNRTGYRLLWYIGF